MTYVYTDGVCQTCSGETDGTGIIIDNDDDIDGYCNIGSGISPEEVLVVIILMHVVVLSIQLQRRMMVLVYFLMIVVYVMEIMIVPSLFKMRFKLLLMSL